jgi:hypothetical protein
MGRRSEVRIAKHRPILVHGTDPSGSPFRIPAKTVDISVTGASLTGLNGAGLPGTKIEIEYQGKKARFRIQWVGKDGTKRANQLGVRCLEPGNFIWGLTPEDFEKLRKLAPPEAIALKPANAVIPPKAAIATSHPRPAEVAIPPHRDDLESEFEFSQDLTPCSAGDVNQSVMAGQPSTADALEAIVRALFRKEVLSRSEVAEELRKLMTVKSS